MIAFHIVKIGEPPGNQASATEAATCYAWALMRGNDQMEVVSFDMLTGDVTHRYSPEESEKIANLFRNAKLG